MNDTLPNIHVVLEEDGEVRELDLVIESAIDAYLSGEWRGKIRGTDLNVLVWTSVEDDVACVDLTNGTGQLVQRWLFACTPDAACDVTNAAYRWFHEL